MLPEPIQAASLVTNIFEQLSIPYFLGGSLASIAHGIVHTTQNTDIMNNGFFRIRCQPL